MTKAAAIEELLDKYYQRGDVDDIYVTLAGSSQPGAATSGIQLLLQCPTPRGAARARDAVAATYLGTHGATTGATTGAGIGLGGRLGGASAVSGSTPDFEDDGRSTNIGEGASQMTGSLHHNQQQQGSGGPNAVHGTPGSSVPVRRSVGIDSASGNHAGDASGGHNDYSAAAAIAQTIPMGAADAGGADGGGDYGNAGDNNLLSDNQQQYGQADDQQQQQGGQDDYGYYDDDDGAGGGVDVNVVRSAVDTMLQIAKLSRTGGSGAFVRTATSASTSGTASTLHGEPEGGSAAGGPKEVTLQVQFKHSFLVHFLSDTVIVSLVAKKSPGRTLAQLAALADEIRAEPVFVRFVRSAKGL